jgi:hypothetical protein
VSWFKARGTWTARIQAGGHLTCIGYFGSAVEAAQRYDSKARELFGEFAVLNFPDGGSV